MSAGRRLALALGVLSLALLVVGALSLFVGSARATAAGPGPSRWSRW